MMRVMKERSFIISLSVIALLLVMLILCAVYIKCTSGHVSGLPNIVISVLLSSFLNLLILPLFIPTLKKWEKLYEQKNLFNKADDFSKDNQLTEAIAVYAELVRRFEKDENHDVREYVAKASVEQGELYYKRGSNADDLYKTQDWDNACKIFNDVIEKFKKPYGEAIRESVARAYVNRGIIHGQRGLVKEACKDYDVVIRDFCTDNYPSVILWVSRACLNKGGNSGYDQLIENKNRFMGSNSNNVEVELYRLAAMAAYNKGKAHDGDVTAYKEAVQISDEASRKFRKIDEVLSKKCFYYVQNRNAPFCYNHEKISFNEVVVRSLWQIASILYNKQDNVQEAVKVYDDVVFRFWNSSNLCYHTFAVQALEAKGNILFNAKRYRDAEAVFNKVIHDFEERIYSFNFEKLVGFFSWSEEAAPIELCRAAFGVVFNQLKILGESRRWKEYVSLCDKIIYMYELRKHNKSECFLINENYEKIVGYKIEALKELGHSVHIIAFCNKIISCEQIISSYVRVQYFEFLKKIYLAKMEALEELSCWKKIIIVHDKMCERLGESKNPRIWLTDLDVEIDQKKVNALGVLAREGSSREEYYNKVIEICNDIFLNKIYIPNIPNIPNVAGKILIESIKAHMSLGISLEKTNKQMKYLNSNIQEAIKKEFPEVKELQ